MLLFGTMARAETTGKLVIIPNLTDIRRTMALPIGKVRYAGGSYSEHWNRTIIR